MIGDEPFGGLLGELAMTAEARTLKYNILADIEEGVEGLDDGVVLFAVRRANCCQGGSVFGIFAKAVK